MHHWWPEASDDIIGEMSDDAATSLQYIFKRLPPRIGSAVLKAICNGWPTETRFGGNKKRHPVPLMRQSYLHPFGNAQMPIYHRHLGNGGRR